MPKNKGKLSLFEKIIYGTGDIGMNAMYTLFISYVLFFYTDVIGMNGAIIGTCIFVSRLFDGISDLIAGHLIDKRKTEKGHCIPVLARWSIPMAISVVLVFLVPKSSVIVRTAYFFITYNLFMTIMYTYVYAAHVSLASYATNDPKERSQMLIYKMMFAALSQTVIANIILPAVELFGGEYSQIAWVKAVMVFSVVGLVFMFLNVHFVKERVDNLAPAENLFKGIKVAFQNKYWIMSLIMYIFIHVFLIFNTTISVYYLKQVVGNIGLMGAWIAVCNIPGIVICLLVPTILARGIKLRQLVFLGCVLMLGGQIAFIFLPNTIPVLLITGLIKGIGFGFPMGMANALVAETIDYGEWKTGTRVQGLLLGAAGVGNKLGQGAITALFGIFLNAIGYDGLLLVQSANAISGINVFFKYGPLLAIVIILVTNWFFDIENINPQIRKELAERRGNL